MKFRWLVITCLSFFFFSTPAYAGKLVFWQFQSNQNRLVFTTDQRVQPTAQLIANPTRLIIDLPGTILGRPTVNQNFGGAITSLRIGQFDAATTRLVIELAPGYTLDPQQIKIKGISPTQWTVELPNPQRITNSNNTPNPSNPSNTPYNPYNQSNNNTYTPITTTNNNTVISNSNQNNNSSSSQGLRVTSSGLLVDINGTINNKINVKRSRDRRKIEFELQGVTIPSSLPKGWNINQYGISQIELAQNSRNPAITKLTLNVAKDSPDWQASFSRMGGLLLWPQGGMSILSQTNSTETTETQPTPINSTPPSNINPGQSYSKQTLIDSIEVNNTELIIRANQKLQARGNWNSSSGIYELRIDNATLSPQFRSPQLRSNSPISRLRIWQPDSNTVVILAQPALGVKVAQFNQRGDQLVALSLTRYSSNVNPPPVNSFPSNNSQNPWDVTPIQTQAPPIQTSPRPLPPVQRGKTLVIIDPGHGAQDPGAIGIGGIQEKQIVLSIALEVTRILEQQGIQVRLTRNSDYFVTLEGRTALANRLNADLFVSIHANSAGTTKPQVNGLETYYFENGRDLAATIHRNILSRVDVNDRKVRKARFYVLRKSNMPSVLVETGFVTGNQDSLKLSNPSYQKQMAAAIAAGIIEYIRANRL